MTADRYQARSANKKTDAWPFWFIADNQRGGLNVTAELMREHFNQDTNGATLATQTTAKVIAAKANKETNQ